MTTSLIPKLRGVHTLLRVSLNSKALMVDKKAVWAAANQQHEDVKEIEEIVQFLRGGKPWGK